MAKNFLYVNADGLYEARASYEQTDFIAASAGAGDAGKPIVLDAAGHIDASMINDADIDHGNLTGLADDDHVIYIKADGTRAFTGDQSMGGFKLTNLADPTAAGDAVSKGFLNSTASGKGASQVGIEDSAGVITATTVEGALYELYSRVTPFGVDYTVGAGGVTKGHLMRISADDTVLPYSDLSQPHRGIGLAFATTAAAGTVRVAANDTVVTGILTGATAGTPYYWNGTGFSSALPAGSGSHVWQVGVAKNATDLHVEVQFVQKNP